MDFNAGWTERQEAFWACTKIKNMFLGVEGAQFRFINLFDHGIEFV